MNLMDKVERIVIERGISTLTDLEKAIAGAERWQVDRALTKLTEKGRVEKVRRLCARKGEMDSNYFVPPGHTVRFSSVWDYAQRA